jgi:hypothetical protein
VNRGGAIFRALATVFDSEQEDKEEDQGGHHDSDQKKESV